MANNTWSGTTPYHTSDRTWSGLTPDMQNRLSALFAASGGQVYLGSGGGARSVDEQTKLFYERNQQDPHGKIQFDGKTWSTKPGMAAAAPPGGSMHEIGLAADLAGPGVTNGWLAQHAAEFGLKTFATVDNEPWHVQPAELPNSRADYERSSGTTSNTSSNPANYYQQSPSGNAQLTGEQVAQVAYQAGFRGEALNEIVGIGKRESNWNAGAHRTDSTNKDGGTGDFGLFQINYVNVPGLIKAGIITQARDLLDPVANAKAAYFLSHQGTQFSPWAAQSGVGWTSNGSPLAGVDLSSARTVVANASTQGLIGTDYQSGGTVPGQDGNTLNTAYQAPDLSTAAGQRMTPPSDATYVNDGNGTVFAVFDVGGGKIAYHITAGEIDLTGKQITNINADQWKTQGLFDGGDITEIGQVQQQFGSYRAFFDNELSKVMGANNPAAKDPSVIAVLLQKASRPDMTDQELQQLLSQTTWYQQHTQGQLNWNGLGDAEKQKQRDDTAASMAQQWDGAYGGEIKTNDPRILNYVDAIASGKMSIGNWFQNVVQPGAAGTDGSPYSQSLKQAGITVENTASNIRVQLTKWGVQWSEPTIQQWARDITNKDKSDDDLLESLKTQAQILYPWKDRDLDTASAASPWMETYNRVMEKQGTLTQPDIQKALTSGTQPWQFEQDLKHSAGWLDTKNARSDLTTMVGNVGKTMGFV